jgi:hypothetical protein
MGVKQERRRAESFICLLRDGFLLGLFFDPEYGDDIFLRNVG